MKKKNEIEMKFFGDEEKILSIFGENLKLEATIKKRLNKDKFIISVKFKKSKTNEEINKWLINGPWEKYLYKDEVL